MFPRVEQARCSGVGKSSQQAFPYQVVSAELPFYNVM